MAHQSPTKVFSPSPYLPPWVLVTSPSYSSLSSPLLSLPLTFAPSAPPSSTRSPQLTSRHVAPASTAAAAGKASLAPHCHATSPPSTSPNAPYPAPSGPNLFDIASLHSLNLAFNLFDEISIPSLGFKCLANLTHLNLSNVGFAGQIPVGIARLTNLVSLDQSMYYLGWSFGRR